MGKRLMENSGSRVAIWRVRDKHVCWNIPRRDFRLEELMNPGGPLPVPALRSPMAGLEAIYLPADRYPVAVYRAAHAPNSRHILRHSPGCLGLPWSQWYLVCPRRKGDASPAQVVTPPPASDDIVRVTVKFSADEHARLVTHGLHYRPRNSNQEMIHDVVMRWIPAKNPDRPHGGPSAPDVRTIDSYGGEQR
jgi:hypothetical protein